MHKDVLIQIKGTVFAEDAPPDVIELITEGKYYTRSGCRYISYAESLATGLAGASTTLKINGEDCVTLIRHGNGNTRFIIEKGRRHLCRYDTGYGDMMMGVSECKIKSGLDDYGGDLSFSYTIDINSNVMSHNEVFINVKEANIQDVKSDEHGGN